jgi:DNA-binding XRE family transcriptional regulator
MRESDVPNLKPLRKEWALEQRDLAFILGVTRETISGWENGHRAPNIPTLRRLAKLFGVSVSYLIGETQERPHRAPESRPRS